MKKLQKSIIRLQTAIRQSASLAHRLLLIIPLFFLCILFAIVYAGTCLYSSPQVSFQQLYQLDPQKGYSISYTVHRRWHRSFQLTTVASSIVIFIVVVFNGIFATFYSTRATNSTIVCTGDLITPTEIIESEYSGHTITFTAGGEAEGTKYCRLTEELQAEDITIESGVALMHRGNYPQSVYISAHDLTIESGGFIDVSTCGYVGATTLGSGAGPGGGNTEDGEFGGGGGGGHGGVGGDGNNGAAGGAVYDDWDNPTDFGSGGGAGAYGSGQFVNGGHGGGVIMLSLTGTLTINGSILADGSAGNGNGTVSGGSGAGGSIHITTQWLAGTGVITANGADATAATYQGGGGAGGRILLRYGSAVSWSGTTSIDGGIGANNGNTGQLTTVIYTIPSTPSVTSPASNATEVSRNPTITASTYSSDGATHQATDWKITTDADGTDIVWSTDDDTTNLENIVANTTNGTFSGTVSGNTALDFETNYYAFVRYTNAVGDSAWSSGTRFTTVENTAPVFTGTIPNQTTSEDIPISNAFDLDDYFDDPGDVLTYTIVDNLDPTLGSIDIDDVTHLVSFTVASDANGSDTVRFRATDTALFTVDSNIVTITLEPVNDPPELAVISDQTVFEEDTLAFSVFVTDPDTLDVSITLLDSQNDFQDHGITLSSLFTDNGNNSGTFNWVPAIGDAGQYQLTIQANDGTTTATQVVNMSVNEQEMGNQNHAPVFSGSIPNISFEAGKTISDAIDLAGYFSDQDDDLLTYAVSGNQFVEVDMDLQGQISLFAPITFEGIETLLFTATDSEGETAQSNQVIITVTEPDDSSVIDEISYIKGTSRGKGIVTVISKRDTVMASWQAFPVGGVVPRLAKISGTSYITTIKYRTGTTVHAYLSDGTLLKKKRISPRLHWRKFAIGNIDGNKKTLEMVFATKRGDTIYFKLVSFKTEKRAFVLRRLAYYQGIQTYKYRVAIKNQQVNLMNRNGKIVFVWKPLK
ncbi:MAG TPA: hypothetical protein VJB65_02860 [Patescibacteria group bacterium]|nr:hypothetical protein [Patescibacteria group bacterium]